MKKIFIRGKRNGYTPKQCGYTMTVGDLIDLLEYIDRDTPIYLENDNGYTFGSITEDDIFGDEENEENE